MNPGLLELLRCPYCGTKLRLVENDALRCDGDRVDQGVLGCECCAYPVVVGIPVLIADDATRRALHTLEEGRAEDALLDLLGADAEGPGRERFRDLVRGADATYGDALDVLCDDAEATYFLYRLTDPTYVVAEALLRAVARAGWPLRGRALDLCGGSGHLARVLERSRAADDASRPEETVLADLHFWKLWLARRFVSPSAVPVCCDANSPLPFARDSFATVLLADAFPYVWNKRLLADEMLRLAGEEGMVLMPHLHSALGENHSAGDTLSPAAYRELFDALGARLFSDAALLDDIVDGAVVDLTRDASPDALEGEPSLTLIASARDDVFRRYELSPPESVAGALCLNPLYRVESDGRSARLTLRFPTPEYEAEFGECRRYLPERLEVHADLTPPLTPRRFGPAYAELRERRVLLDAPVGYGV